MSDPQRDGSQAFFPRILMDLGRAVACLAAAAALGGCGERESGGGGPAAASGRTEEAARVDTLTRQLAASRLAAARERLAADALDEALAWTAAALAADPENAGAGELARDLLGEVRWPLVRWELPHGLRVERIACGGQGSLFVALAAAADGADFRTVVRWETPGFDRMAVLFPVAGGTVSELWAAPGGPALIVTRGGEGGQTRLLCSAETLEPVAELGLLPAGLTGEAVMAGDGNGLLFAGPETAEDGRTVWRIRDAASGGVVRTLESAEDAAPPPVAAWMDSSALRILFRDGSLALAPVSPVKPVELYKPNEPQNIVQARFSADGGRILGLWDSGGGRAPERRLAEIGLRGEEEGAEGEVVWAFPAEKPDGSWWRSPWTAESPWWNSLLRDHGNPQDPPALRLEEGVLFFADGRHAPLRGGESPVVALAFQDDLLFRADAAGTVTVVDWLSAPERLAAADAGLAAPDPVWFGGWCTALSGFRHDEEAGGLVRLDDRERRRILEGIGPEAALRLLSGLDFSLPLSEAARAVTAPPSAAWQPLWDRLARADASGRSWPLWLELGQALGDSRWHQQLAAELRRRNGEDGAELDGSPWEMRRRMRGLAAAGDDAAFNAGLAEAGENLLPLAAALDAALEGASPERIAACLEAAGEKLPPMLRALATSRIAWLEGRTADAAGMWPETFPELAKVRAVQDWDGWEQEDFAARYREHTAELEAEFARYDVARAGEVAEMEAAAARLLEPEARRILGRRRLAEFCLNGALALDEADGEPETVRALARRARDSGGDAAAALRAEALAHNHLKNFEKALPLWIELLTGQAPEALLASDYAEAAYTAFEVMKPDQAMEILTTGVRRFGQDPGFALQAGWISLLTGNHGRAYQFLLAGMRVGFPEEVRENSLLLLAVAASLAGFPEDAASHYFNLLEYDPVWSDPAAVEELDWPQELKNALHQLISAEPGPDVMLPDDLPLLPDL